MLARWYSAVSAVALLSSSVRPVSAQYLIGVGIGDVTGPVVETNMMGYADLAQTDTGLHMRERSRAFIIADAANPSRRVVFVNADIGMGDSGIRRGIVKRLSALYPGVYDETNIGLAATHSHAGVGGYVENLLPQLTSLGFVKETYDAIVEGTVKAVVDAHNDLGPGSLSIGSTEILQGNINRSPSAYLANPAAERAKYDHDQDKEMSLIKFTAEDGTAKGFLSFYPVHGTSLLQNNTLVSGDNKGMAAYLYENYVEPNSVPGNTSFVAGFVQANCGDSSPNTLGAFCWNPAEAYHGTECSFNSSTCGGKSQDCRGRGPGFRTSDFQSNYLIGSYQFEGAKTIMESSSLKAVEGTVRAVHSFVDMTKYTFKLANGTTVHTCPPAMGYSFAAGTTDGPGAFDFTQGTTSPNPFWDIVKGAVTPAPSAEQAACHAPKPILLNTGYATAFYDWQPKTVDVQIFRIGQVVIILVPGEFTTMAGRRIKETLRAQLIAQGILDNDAVVLLAGPSNTYGHYITTREEYNVQRYEGASTIYGPFTLEAYLDIYGKLLPYLADNATSAPNPGVAPPDLTKSPLSLRTGVVVDGTPVGSSYGKVLTPPNASYTRGSTVSVRFQAANPRNNHRLEKTFLTVERQVGTTWVVYRTDSHPSTKFHWLRTNGLFGWSEVTINWDIESDAPTGSYRIVYYGDNKEPFTGNIKPFVGTSPAFTVA